MQDSNFKIGDIIQYAGKGSEAYVVDTDGISIRVLFFDGSIGWHNIESSNFKRTSMEWDFNKLRDIVKLGFSKYCRIKNAGYIDNLTYIELLALLNEYAK